MKLLVLCYEYPPLGGGGGRVAQAIAEQLVKRGHEVRVQTAALGWRSKRETINGVEVFRTASLRRREDTCGVHEMGLYCATSFLPTLKHIWKWKPDVIHAHFAMPTGLLAYAVHKITGVPYVLTAHLGDVPGGVPEQTDNLFRLINPIAELVWKSAAACTAVSSFVQKLAETAYERKVVRVLNGVELDQTETAYPRSEVPRVRHLVFVGRLSVQKNPVFLIDILARLLHPSWKLTLVGDGPYMDEVRQRIATTKLTEKIIVTGWLDSTAVQRTLSDADILVMPSLSEGLPVAGVEALKHGLAIVASDIPGLHDVVEDGVNGYRVPRGDVAAFAHKLNWLLESDSALLAMKHASWKKAREFDLTAITDQYEEVLRSCR